MNKYLIKKSRGFTLIELLAVIAIIGILSAVTVSFLNDARARGRDTKRMIEMRELQKAIEMYTTNHGVYLTSGHFSSAVGCGSRTGGATGDFSEVFAPLINNGYLAQLPSEQNGGWCYQYSRQTGSVWTCNSGAISINDYHYVLQFRTEGTEFNLPASDQTWTYCLLGPLR